MTRLQQTGSGLGSDISLTVLAETNAQAKTILRSLWSQIEGFEQRFSRFRPESELSHLNQAAGQSVSASAELIDLLSVAKSYAEQTDGLYNPFTLPALQKAGYKGSWPKPSSFVKSLNFSDREVATADQIKLIGRKVLIPPGSALDFGGIGKGYLLDKLADWLCDQGLSNYWLSLGGDIICHGHNLDDQPWQVGLASATSPEAVIKQIVNKSGQRLAMATSGITKRKGPGWHHLIDPRTNLPAETDLLSATMVHSSATQADVYAKCLVILGSRQAKQWLGKIDYVSVYLQTTKANQLIDLTSNVHASH